MPTQNEDVYKALDKSRMWEGTWQRINRWRLNDPGYLRDPSPSLGSSI